MPNRVDTIVIFPRFTPFVGEGPMYSPPFSVRPYAEALLTGWESTGFGASPSDVEFFFEESIDLEAWTDAGSLALSTPGVEATGEVGIYYPWFRVRAEVSGADPALSCWLLGQFVRREVPGAGGAS